MKDWVLKWSGTLLVPLLCMAVGLALLLTDPLPMQALRNALFDQYQRWHPREYVAAPVRVVDIDDESLNRMGQWPWPRTRVAEMVEKLRQGGAAAIGFDVVFAEPDRTSPVAMSQLWQLQGEAASAIARLPDHDAVFAQTIAGGGVVLGRALQATASPGTSAPMDFPEPFRYVVSGGDLHGWLHPFDAEVNSLPGLVRPAAGLGVLTFKPDSDGVVRRVPMALELRGKPVPSLAAETLRVGQDAKNYIIKRSDVATDGIQEVRIGGVTVPTTAQAEVWVHYTRPYPQRYIPAWKVFEGQVPPAELEGNLILVGTSAQGLMDLRSSPMGTIMAGVEAHAQALEQILTGGGLSRPGWAKSVEALALGVGSLMVGVLALRARAMVGAAVTLGLMALLAWGGWHAFVEQRQLYNVITPLLSVGFTFVICSLLHHFSSERQQRFVKEAFSRYVSPNLVQHLVSHPGQLELGGRRQQCSFIFTDLAGFTSLMEMIDPGEAVSLLNAYLDRMIGIAFSHNGTLDRIVGDAVAIMFSAPVPQEDHQARAVACALEMDAFATAYARDLQAKGIAFGMTRIGVHTGEVIVGNFGGSTIFDYRALGDPVNTAARLESVNKHLGTRMCVSGATLSGAPGTEARPVGALVLKGKSRPLEVWEPITSTNTEGRAPLSEYRAAYAAIAEESPQAQQRLAELANAYPDDPLVALHLRRLNAGEHGVVITMSEK